MPEWVCPEGAAGDMDKLWLEVKVWAEGAAGNMEGYGLGVKVWVGGVAGSGCGRV